MQTGTERESGHYILTLALKIKASLRRPHILVNFATFIHLQLEKHLTFLNVPFIVFMWRSDT